MPPGALRGERDKEARAQRADRHFMPAVRNGGLRILDAAEELAFPATTAAI